MEFKENNIVFLLGAGCSKESGIPISNEMVNEVEKLLIDSSSEWPQYKSLYHYLKSSIDYSEGIFGNFQNSFNIERLLIVMSQIEQRDRNIIYPFIGSWNIRLPEVAGENFEKISKFKRLINKKLYEWVCPKQLSMVAEYYSGFKKLQSEIGYPMKVFSLNYDECFEKIIGEDSVEQGFDPKTFEWQQSNFEQDSAKTFKLYKLHGSINWYTDIETGKLKRSENPITDQEPELIFGIDTKLDSRDPYFYYTSEFRRWVLDNNCRLIVTIGYSYADQYINNLISQALISDKNRQVLNVTFCAQNEEEALKSDITKNKLLLNKHFNKDAANQFKVLNTGAKEFLTEKLSAEFLSKYVKDDDEAPFH